MELGLLGFLSFYFSISFLSMRGMDFSAFFICFQLAVTTSNITTIILNSGMFYLFFPFIHRLYLYFPSILHLSSPHHSQPSPFLFSIVDNMVFRISALYGPVEHIMESPVSCLFPKVRNSADACVMSDYERRYPTSTEDLAKVFLQLMEKRLEVCVCV